MPPSIFPIGIGMFPIGMFPIGMFIPPWPPCPISIPPMSPAFTGRSPSQPSDFAPGRGGSSRNATPTFATTAGCAASDAADVAGRSFGTDAAQWSNHTDDSANLLIIVREIAFCALVAQAIDA
jgi:hypothetical protein